MKKHRKAAGSGNAVCFRVVEQFRALVNGIVEENAAREKLRPDIQIERYISQSPPELLIAPDWGLKNYEFADKLRKRMRERGLE